MTTSDLIRSAQRARAETAVLRAQIAAARADLARTVHILRRNRAELRQALRARSQMFERKAILMEQAWRAQHLHPEPLPSELKRRPAAW